MMYALRASPAFALVSLVTLGVFGFIGAVLFLPGLSAALLGQEMAGHISGHFRSPHHRVHDLTFSFLFGTSVVGVLAQLQRPSENVAGQLMALIPWVALLLTFSFTNGPVPFAPAPILAALTLLAAILHPAGRNFFASFRVSRVNRAMLALVIIAAVPLLAFASIKIGLQKTATNDHAALGHYGFMAAFCFTVIGVGLLASLRPDGWRLTAWAAGLLPALLALTSLVYPDVDSSLGPVWAVAALAWGIGFVTTSELTRHAEGPARRASWGSPDPAAHSDTGMRPDRESTPGTSTWMKVLGIIALVVAVLLVIAHLTVGGLGSH